ncbi:peptidoglycan-binding protein [uncultured Cohaesibacter sp.]|uniref:peptidoglycan-binding protein n=1 Tax=uncultured Cohaesibacter sp. TaxID=1002546 RepID=UPI0029C7E2BB|nr:peptidoglycan-binding protein [uncultured Cohaesibacter sp.]
MIDETYHTDRDVGEYIEGLRGTDRDRQSQGRSGGGMSQKRNRQNSALLDAIEDIESQLQALASQTGLTSDARRESEASRDHLTTRTTRENRRDGSAAFRQGKTQSAHDPVEHSHYGSALERIEAQLQRVDHALERQGSKPMASVAQRQDTAGYGSAIPRERVPYRASGARLAAQPAYRADMAQMRAGTAEDTMTYSNPSFDSAMRRMIDRSQELNEQMARTAEESVSEISRNAQTALDAANQSQGSYREALDKLAKLQSQDESLNILRDDVSSLRRLIEEANLSGASDNILREIANLSGRIEQLSTAISETREDPALLDTMHEIRALLDRPTLDPSIDAHFDRILSRLDDMDGSKHQEDFARLSEQMDHLRDILAAQPDMQHLSSISGQMNELIDRLAMLEEDVRHTRKAGATATEQSDIGHRLSQMQDLIERMDPGDRLASLEDQLSSLADRLESGVDQSNIHKPLEALARQVESLVELTDQRNQSQNMDLMETLVDRVTSLDQYVRHEQMPVATERRFDQVEQTLARIDDMLANKMESADLSSLERSLSRLADRMEAQEDLLRTAPQAIAGGQASGVSDAALSQLEKQIVDLAQRLDNASLVSDDSQFFEMLTGRLDKLAEEFTRTQKRFEAVDRIGADIRQIAENASPDATHSAKVAEQAAIKALQQVGPLAGGGKDDALEAIIDGLKDDLHGLRRFAETSDNSTQQSLTGVSSILNAIVDRLGKLEDQVRAEESLPLASREGDAAPSAAENEGRESSNRGLGNILRRRKAKADAGSDQPDVEGRALSASDLLQNRGGQSSRRQQPKRSAPQVAAQGRPAPTSAPASAPSATAAAASASQTSSATGEDRQPGIFLSGKAVSVSGSKQNVAASTPQAPQGAPQVAGNVALKAEEQTPPVAPAVAKPRTARIVQDTQGSAQGSAARVGSASRSDQGQSKADFIAAARRAAQAAAQESAKVEKEQGEASGFLARFKGSKKADESKPAAAAVGKVTEQVSGKGLSRKERRAAITEAARLAKQMKKDEQAGQIDPAALEEGAVQLLEDEQASNSLFAKLGHSFSRHSRPLLMAAAAILLAITTIQLVKNPDSSLYGLFNSEPAQSESSMDAPATENAPALEVAPEGNPAIAPNAAPADVPVMEQPAGAGGNQSNITPSSGNVVPHMSDEEATRAIAFAQPALAQPTLAQDASAGPRSNNASNSAMSYQLAMAKAKAMLGTAGNEGLDITPTSSIGKPASLDHSGEMQSQTASQPMPPVVDEQQANLANAATDNQPLEPTPIMQAADSGNTLAQFELGRRFTVGEGVDSDLGVAASWFEKAAKLNMPQAQYSLANLYEKGQGVRKDLQVSRLWYQRAAEQGNVKSMHNLAVLYAEGGLGKPDFQKAAQWFLQAADHGLKDSQYNLAILFARGMGVKQDLLQSYKWFAIAAQQGDKGAEAKRDEILAVLSGPQQKAAKALVAAWAPKQAKQSANEISALPASWVATTPEQLSRANQRLAADQRIIAKAQNMLGALGYSAGPADGQMGPRTRMAIRNFQEIAGLKVTGEIDAALLEALAQRTL